MSFENRLSSQLATQRRQEQDLMAEKILLFNEACETQISLYELAEKARIPDLLLRAATQLDCCVSMNFHYPDGLNYYHDPKSEGIGYDLRLSDRLRWLLYWNIQNKKCTFICLDIEDSGDISFPVKKNKPPYDNITPFTSDETFLKQYSPAVTKSQWEANLSTIEDAVIREIAHPQKGEFISDKNFIRPKLEGTRWWYIDNLIQDVKEFHDKINGVTP